MGSDDQTPQQNQDKSINSNPEEAKDHKEQNTQLAI